MDLRTRIAVPLIAAAAIAAAAASADTDTTPSSSTTTTTTTTLAAADSAAADWDRQDCPAAYGPIISPDSLPPHDDGKGCQHLLHDWRNAQLSAALAGHAHAQAAVDALEPAWNAARRTRNQALAAVKTAEISLAEAVAQLAPPTSSTTAAPPPSKPPLPGPTTTTTTTTVPHHLRPHALAALWASRYPPTGSTCSAVANLASPGNYTISIAAEVAAAGLFDWSRIDDFDDQAWTDHMNLCRWLIGQWAAAGYTPADDHDRREQAQ